MPSSRDRLSSHRTVQCHVILAYDFLTVSSVDSLTGAFYDQFTARKQNASRRIISFNAPAGELLLQLHVHRLINESINNRMPVDSSLYRYPAFDPYTSFTTCIFVICIRALISPLSFAVLMLFARLAWYLTELALFPADSQQQGGSLSPCLLHDEGYDKI